MALKPWREIAVPHEDVLKGTFQQAEFAADLSRVHAGKATPEYQDPVLFFQRTYITEGMRLPFGLGAPPPHRPRGDPVIQLQTAFGGGKTHTELAVYLPRQRPGPGQRPARGVRLSTPPGSPPCRGRGWWSWTATTPNQPLVRDGQALHTLGRFARQLAAPRATPWW